MKRPSMQFYPADWRNNAKLRRCSHEERGVWLDVMCLMHDSDEYGVLRWPLREIAQAVGIKEKILRNLAKKEVLKGSDSGDISALVYTPKHARKEGDPVTLLGPQEGPIWYSSRMVTDEYLRSVRGSGTRFGEAPKVAPKGGIGAGMGEAPKVAPTLPQGDGASASSSSTSKSKEQELPTTSVAAATPAIDPLKAMIDGALAHFRECGVAELQARSLIGMLRKNLGDLESAEVLAIMAAEKIQTPASWIKRTIDTRLANRKTAAQPSLYQRVPGEF